MLIRARYPVLYIVSAEEQRVESALLEAGKARQKRVFTWSYSTGLVAAGTSLQSKQTRNNATKDPIQALDQVVDHVEPALYIFKDLHPFLAKNQFAVIRRLKEVAQELKSSWKTIVLVAPVLELPCELEKEVVVVDFPLPTRADLEGLLARIAADVKGQPGIKVDDSQASREALVQAASGLTLGEAESVFAKILVAKSGLSASDVGTVFAEKRQIVRKSGLLDYCEPEASLGEVGGLEVLKGWLKKRELAFSEKARSYGLSAPKGVLLLGVQGCGKSLCAKAVAALWRMPLLRLDMGRLFGSLVGSSEENVRRAIAVAESVAPVVLWVDEMDKGLAGARGSSTDSGTTARVFAAFLTWLAEKKSSVFVVATANDVTALPPELLRKGRFDEIFFVDLPTERERRDILAIHLARRKRDPKAFPLDVLARGCLGFSGAEIEQAIVSALFDSFSEGKEVTGAHIGRAIGETVPLSRMMSADIDRLRRWAEGRTRRATEPDPVSEGAPPRPAPDPTAEEESS